MGLTLRESCWLWRRFGAARFWSWLTCVATGGTEHLLRLGVALRGAALWR